MESTPIWEIYKTDLDTLKEVLLITIAGDEPKIKDLTNEIDKIATHHDISYRIVGTYEELT